MNIVLIDNYDSFTYNLSHLVKELGANVDILKNDAFEMNDLERYDKILLSPGPGVPTEAGQLLEVIKTYAGKKPILGICLGEQAIAEAFGGTLINLEQVYHGIQAEVTVNTDDYLFKGLPTTIQVGRYHSWVVSPKQIPSCIEVISHSTEGNIMAIRHKTLDLRGIQFHPESVLTPYGKEIMKNWLSFFSI